MDKANRNHLRHFNVDMSKFEDTAKFVVSIIKVNRRFQVEIGYSAMLTNYSATSKNRTPQSHHTADGSTSRLVGARVSTNSWPLGRAPSTHRNERDG